MTAGVAYGCATFIDLTISTWSESYAADYSLTRVFLIFVVVLAIASVLNIFSSHLMAVMNNVSVWWHVAGAAIIVGILLIVPGHPPELQLRLHRADQQLRLLRRQHVQLRLLLRRHPVRLPAHAVHDHRLRRLRPPQRGDQSAPPPGAAKGIWQSILYSAIGGYILLLCVVFAVPNLPDGSPDNSLGAGGVAPIFNAALGSNWAGAVLFISSAGQLFCAVSCMTSASRMTYAFSRDRAVPGSRHWSELSAKRVPAKAVMLVAVLAAIVTLPALVEVNIGTAEAPIISPIAFFAVTSIAVAGLYLSFAIPIWLRWRHGDNFEAGEWNNGAKYKWMNPLAVAEIIIVVLFLMWPSYIGGLPGSDVFEWKFVNYSPIVTIGVLIAITVWWEVSAKKWFKGPIRTIDPAEVP